MKRRDFLLYSMSSMSMASPILAFGQTRPCPVPELSAGGAVVHTSCEKSELELAALALGPGQSSATLGDAGLSSDALFTIQWANRFFYDHATGVAHLLGKNASSQGRERSHCIYHAATNRWEYAIYGGDETGHVYESLAYDPAEGVVYTGRWSSSPTPIQVWRAGTPLDAWSTTSTAPWSFSNTNATQPVLCWHPNLFGAGDGGLLALRLVSGSTVEIVAWRRASDSWTRVSGSSHSASGGSPQYGAIEYVKSAGHAIATFATGNTYTIGAGSGGSPVSAVQISDPPIRCRHAGGGNNVGILIDDPTAAGGPYILEKGGSNRVWKYLDGSWSLRDYTHPLPDGSATDDTNWVVASLYPLGVFWARNNRSGSSTRLWRPVD